MDQRDGAAKRYLVRQYRPAYVSGFNNGVMRDVAYGEITAAPWLENFKYDGFTHFTIEPYADDELIISARYKDGKHWVAGFALPTTSNTKAPDGGLLRDNWRYHQHES